jgi:UDP-N-acetyl-D-galactosamine dehydrogenase
VAEAAEAMHEYGVKLVSWADLAPAGAIVAAVSHKELTALTPAQIGTKLLPGGVYTDVKCAANAAALTELGFGVWRL